MLLKWLWFRSITGLKAGVPAGCRPGRGLEELRRELCTESLLPTPLCPGKQAFVENDFLCVTVTVIAVG